MIESPVVTNTITETLREDSVLTGKKGTIPLMSRTSEGKKGTRKRHNFLLGRA